MQAKYKESNPKEIVFIIQPDKHNELKLVDTKIIEFIKQKIPECWHGYSSRSPFQWDE